jgi:hypothetical protein
MSPILDFPARVKVSYALRRRDGDRCNLLSMVGHALSHGAEWVVVEVA